ncbi:MAG: NAD(P)/FAD-dependent oxidoreductase [Flavobacteriales bacterium]|nr:NAD(P)/FAD-dependent oxidoreductase [Flavobacteriales bacterium]MBP9079221.1 NAD(P)/FAD-dependent oxidoreductase [Flavobacteriales bacterium]
MKTPERAAFDALSYPTVVVVGGGFAGLELIKRLAGKPFKVILLDKNNYHCFQPLLYQVATGSLGADNIAHPFRRTVGPMPNVIYRMAEVLRVLPEAQCVETDHGRVPYDHLVLATGTVTNFFGNQRIAHEAMQLKSIGQALDIRSDFLQEFEAAVYMEDEHKQRQRLNFVVVGGGPSGVELAGALAEIRKTILKHEFREVDNRRMQIHLVDSGDAVLGNFSGKAQGLALKFLEQLGVQVKLNTLVTGYDGKTITFKDGSTMDSSTVIWTAGVKGAPVAGLETSVEERPARYRVDAYNRVAGTRNIYAIGDIALDTSDPHWPKGHPQVAPVAVQQAAHLAKNLLRKPGTEWAPYTFRDKGSMATIGRYKAVVDLGKLKFGGPIAWFLWLFVHLMSIVGFRSRVMVLTHWAWKYLSWRNTIRLIIRPYVRKEYKVEQPEGAAVR